MELQFLEIYALCALAAGLTSYIMLYRPAIKLLEEIVDRRTNYSSWVVSSLWIIFAAILTPFTVFLLLKNKNDTFIAEFAVALAERMEIDDDDE